MTCQGHYDSESAFSAAGQQTQIEYRLNLRANVPMPVTLRLIPSALISGAAHNILHLRTAEIMAVSSTSRGGPIPVGLAT